MNEKLIEILKNGRLQKKLKQSTVAEKIGVKSNTISNYENGVSEPDIDTFCALCDIYNLDPARVLGEAYGLNIQGTNFSIKPSEIDHIKSYRNLDTHGQHMVNVVLKEEQHRSVKEKVKNTNTINKEPTKHKVSRIQDDKDYLKPVAAHNDNEITDEELDLMRQDVDEL